jgi:hypothetical protein
MGRLKDKIIIAPVSAQEENVYHLVSCKFEHLILLACVSTTRDSLALFVLTADPILDSL